MNIFNPKNNMSGNEENPVVKNDKTEEEVVRKDADSVSAKYYDDMPMELVEYLVKTDPRFAEKPKESKESKEVKEPREQKHTYSKEKEIPKKNMSGASANPSSFTTSKPKAYIKKTPKRSILLLSSVVLVLITMFFLILSINNNEKFDSAINELENLKNLSAEFTKLQNENTILKQRVTSLEKILEDNATPVIAQTPTAPTDDDDEPSTVTEETLYTVASGDNLSKISIKFYGNASHVDKILSANGMTSNDILRIGTQLKIPPL